MPSLVKGLLGFLGTLAAATPPLLAAFGVDWTDAETALVSAESVTAVALVSAITAWATATLALVTGFGWWDLTEEQIAVVLSFLTAVVNGLGALIARSRVTPTAG
jgi:hypothetical protein